MYCKGGEGGVYTAIVAMFMENLNDGLMHYLDPTDGIKKVRDMRMELTTVIDCTGAKLGTFPVTAGELLAGYVTGTGDVPWTPGQFAAHPDAVRIDQWPTLTESGATADVIDVEPGAVTIEGIVPALNALRVSFTNGIRPGQRWPAVYVERSELTPAANALNAAGITENVPLWLTEPMPEHAAIDILNASGGPFPIIAVQYAFNSDYDISLVSTEWLNYVSKAPENTQAKPGTQAGWRFCSKCQSLFFGPGEARSMCPRGGLHDGSHSHDYVLGYDQ